MELFRSVLGSSGLSSGAGDSSGGPSSAETIERLVDRLEHATLIEDRRDACRALKVNDEESSRRQLKERSRSAAGHVSQIPG